MRSVFVRRGRGTPLLLAAAAGLSACAGAGDLPVADAGADVSTSPGVQVDLDATASTSPGGDSLTYSWRFDSVPSASGVENADFSDNDSATASRTSFTPDVPGLYGVVLVVSDGERESDADYVAVQVGTGNHPPVADAGEDQFSETGAITYLYGAGIDEDEGDVLTYRWRFELVPPDSEMTDQDINNQGTPTPVILPDVEGMYVLTLTVSDGEAESAPDYVTVVVGDGNHAPVADAGTGGHLTPCSGYEVQLDGGASYDPEGTPLSFLWAVIGSPAGSAPTLSDEASQAPVLTWDVVGPYTVELVVDDSQKQSPADYVVFDAVAPTPNAPPVADGGGDVLIESTAFCISGTCSPCSDRVVTLDGTGSFDPDHDPLSWQWQVTSGTGWTLEADVNDVASLTIPDLATTLGHTATATYQVQLTVADCASTDQDSVTITFTCEGG